MVKGQTKSDSKAVYESASLGNSRGLAKHVGPPLRPGLMSELAVICLTRSPDTINIEPQSCGLAHPFDGDD